MEVEAHENPLIKKSVIRLQSNYQCSEMHMESWTTWARNFKKGFCIWMSELRMEVDLETFISYKQTPYKMGTKNHRMNKEGKNKTKHGV